MVMDLFEVICKAVLICLAVAIGLTILSFLWGMGPVGFIASILIGYLVYKEVMRKREQK